MANGDEDMTYDAGHIDEPHEGEHEERVGTDARELMGTGDGDSGASMSVDANGDEEEMEYDANGDDEEGLSY